MKVLVFLRVCMLRNLGEVEVFVGSEIIWNVGHGENSSHSKLGS